MYFLLFSPQPMCDNHDDGETAAIILCNMCGNLCTDCDRFLHLHRRTRSHQRQVSVGRHTFHFISMMGFFPGEMVFNLHFMAAFRCSKRRRKP